MSKGTIMQMGSFNPLHRMHRRIADDAKARYPEYSHNFCMAIQTCDKGENSLEELTRRIKAIEAQGYRAAYTKSGLFIDVIKKHKEWFPEEHLVFPVGEDTIYRFFRDWDKFYTDNHRDDYLKRFEDYVKAFDNVEWYVSKRDCPERAQYAPLMDMYMKHLDNIAWSSLDLDDISSTKIRSGEVVNE